jgi:hypothetical protein
MCTTHSIEAHFVFGMAECSILCIMKYCHCCIAHGMGGWSARILYVIYDNSYIKH